MRGSAKLDRVAEVEGRAVKVNAICAQMVCYMAMAKSYTPSWTIEDLPRTLHSRKAALHAEGLQRALYANVFNRYNDLQVLYQQDSNSPAQSIEASSWNTDLRKQLATLLPASFEARLVLASWDFRAGLPFNEQALKQILDEALELHSPRRTYSFVADMILSSTVLKSSTQSGSSIQTSIPTSIALHLLWQTVQGVGRLSECDVRQAARWIRCFVQVGLDCLVKEWRSVHLSRAGRESLEMVDKIRQQVILLAQTGAEEMTRNSLQTLTPLYPAEELEWLSITFFNLSVDLFVLGWKGCSTQAGQARGSVASTHSQIPFLADSVLGRRGSHPGTSPAGAYPRSGVVAGTSAARATSAEQKPTTVESAAEGDDDLHIDPANVEEGSVESPRHWARSAIELADLLKHKLEERLACFQSHMVPGDARSSNDEMALPDDYTSEGRAYGDGGTLAGILRARCQELGWEL